MALHGTALDSFGIPERAVIVDARQTRTAPMTSGRSILDEFDQELERGIQRRVLSSSSRLASRSWGADSMISEDDPPQFSEELRQLSKEARAKLSLRCAERARIRIIKLLHLDGMSAAADHLARAPGFFDPQSATQTGNIVEELWAADLSLGMWLGRWRLDSNEPDNFSSLQRTQGIWALTLLFEALVFGFGRPSCEDGPQRAVDAGIEIAAILSERESEIAALHSDLETVANS